MGIRVLLVDDDATILLTLAAILRLEGLEVATCSTADQAIRRVAHDNFQLVITDMRMEAPDAGCAVVRAAAGCPIAPIVIVLTAFPIPKNDLRALGAAIVLLKGSSPGFLLHRIREIVSSIQTQGPGSPDHVPRHRPAP